MPWYLSMDIVCSSKHTGFFELRSRKTVRLSVQIKSADNKYPSIFSRKMESTVFYIVSGYAAPDSRRLTASVFLLCKTPAPLNVCWCVSNLNWVFKTPFNIPQFKISSSLTTHCDFKTPSASIKICRRVINYCYALVVSFIDRENRHKGDRPSRRQRWLGSPKFLGS